jgi:DNA (cytosine-5)-methyltransferase 1
LNRWPDAAYGETGRIRVFEASAWPLRHDYRHLLDLLAPCDSAPLSHRAASGFLERASRSRLKFIPAFVDDLREHVVFMRGSGSPESENAPSRRLDIRRTQHEAPPFRGRPIIESTRGLKDLVDDIVGQAISQDRIDWAHPEAD